MSVSHYQWFTNWSPPNHQLFSEPFNTYQSFDDDHQTPIDHHHGTKSTSSNMIKFIPYLLTLGALKPVHTEEDTGPFKTHYSWQQLDYAYPDEESREEALDTGSFVQENNLPLGIEVYADRIFVSVPKWKDGVPVTLGTLPKTAKEKSPKIQPYPDWSWHDNPKGSCRGLTSVYRMQADECGRLWVMDSGQIDVTIKPRQICPPTLFIFDLKTDRLLVRYELPENFIKQDSLYSNIKVDIRKGDCVDAYAYMTDVWRFGLVVFSLKSMHSWRITDHLFYPDPLAAAYHLDGLDFEWTDGIFGMALSPLNKKTQDRILYFHPMSSFREFYVKTSVIRNETDWENVKDAFKVMGQSRGKSGHASASAMDRNGVLFYNLVTRNAVGCWDSRKPYKRRNQGVVAQDDHTMVFPNDLKIDNENRQSLWIITNKLPIYLYRGLNKEEDNFRILTAYTDRAVQGTICDPSLVYEDSLSYHEEEPDCY